jgi:glycosyltransferase involved in cell wall biosynthesis
VASPDARLIAPERRKQLAITEYPHLTLPIWGRLVLHSLLRDLSRQPPDLIHVQSRSMQSCGQWLANRLGIPIVLTVHDYLASGERLRFDTKSGKRIIAVSQSVRTELLQRTRVPEHLVTVIPGGVEAHDVNDLLAVLDPGHVPVVGMAGPLEAIKGHPFFLGAAQRVLSTHDQVEFLVAGAGPEEVGLRRLADELGIAEKVTFLPSVADFSASLTAMDIFCLPSLQQGIGTIMLEAMALARPVIATGVGGVYSVVNDNKTGLVVPPSDSGRLAERIVELLDDPVRARAIGEAGRQLVHNEFGLEAMVQQTAAVYREVLEAEAN